MILTDLRVNHLTTPVGFLLQPIAFSWKVAENREAKRQKWARIRVYKEQDCIYDSGCDQKASSLGTQAEFELEPRKIYRWSVEVATDTKETAFAESFFETGKLYEPWQGQWLVFPSKKVLPVFKKEFMAETVHTGRLYVCCTGFYEVWLNGKKAGKEYLTSGNLSETRLEIQTYDVTDLLKTGTNTLLLWVSRNAGQVNCELYGDSHLLICTDEKWKYTASPIVKADLREGEIYDARKAADLGKTENWKKCETKSQKETALQNKADTVKKQMHTVIDRCHLPVYCKDVLGQRLLTTPEKEKVFDFGQYMTGWVEFENHMSAGMKVQLTVGELHDGHFCSDDPQRKQAKYTYISAGKPEHVRPHFAVYCFRYIKIEVFEEDGMPSEQVISNILTEWKGIHLRKDRNPVGTVRTGIEYVNRLFLNAQWSWKNAMLDVITDEKEPDIWRQWNKERDVLYEESVCNAKKTDLLLKEDYPGWLYAVRQGATTLWDDWNVTLKTRQHKTEKMADLRDSGYAEVESWMYSYICGIRPVNKKRKKIQIIPHPDRRLGFASARVETEAGTVKSAWKYNQDHTITYKIEIPFNTEAEVIFPDETLHIEAGRHVIRK